LWLHKIQTDSFLRDVESNAHIPFTADNIHGTLQNVYHQRRKLFEQSVANVFEALTKYYKGNSNHTEGWKSNELHKVNLKLVFPYGCRYWLGGFDLCGDSGEAERSFRKEAERHSGMMLLDGAGKCSASSSETCPERSGGRMPLAEKGVRGKGRQPLSPPQR
jgi:hypothetical protein